MPFHSLHLSEESGARPSLSADESILYEQPLTWLWSGARIIEDREGRGTLLLTSRRVLFLSDEDPENRSYGWNYSDFSLHATSTSRIEWPHHFLLAKIAPAESATEGDEETEERKHKDAPAMWTRRSKRSAPDADDDPYSDSEDAAVAPDGAATPSSTAVTAGPIASASPPSLQVESEWEDRVVEELRFVPSKPEQLKLMYAAWNRGDDLNTSDTDEADAADEDETKHDAVAASSFSAGAAAVPADLRLSASIPAGRSPAPSTARQAMLQRLDRMLVVAPVIPSQNPLPLPPSPPDSPQQQEDEMDSYAGFVFAPPAAAAAASAVATPASLASQSAATASAVPPSGPLRSCISCLVDRHESDYSGAQLKKKSKRVCKRCVARKEGLEGPTIMAAAQQPAQQTHALSYAGAGTGSLPSQAVQPSSSAALFASIIATATKNLEELKLQPE